MVGYGCLALSYPFGFFGCSQRKIMTNDTILFLITLPIMLVLVIFAFINFIPDFINVFAGQLHWLTQ